MPVGHLFVLFCEVVVESFVHFCIELVVLLLSFKISLYILDISSLCDICVMNVLPNLWLAFFVCGIFRRRESFFLVKLNSSVFFFMVHACFSIQETFFCLSIVNVVF